MWLQYYYYDKYYYISCYEQWEFEIVSYVHLFDSHNLIKQSLDQNDTHLRSSEADHDATRYETFLACFVVFPKALRST